MNIKLSSITFLVAAVASISFSQQAAHAGNGMRFEYAPNEFALDAKTGRRGSRYAAPHTEVAPIAAGSVPKNSLLNSDFVSRPAPPPVVAAAPIAQPSVSAKVQAPSMFNSLFNPVKSDPGLVAANPGKLPAFGAPIAQSLPATPKAAEPRRTTNTSIAWTKPHRPQPTALAAAPFKMPATKIQSSGFQLGQNIPTATNSGSSASTNVQGVIVSKGHH